MRCGFTGVFPVTGKHRSFHLPSRRKHPAFISPFLPVTGSRSISENTTWGVRKSFADGKVRVSFSKFLGYDEGFVINEEEAKTVRLI